MKLIKQHNGVDCGLAVSAMLSGKTWDNAADADPNPDSEGGVCVDDMLCLLKKLTGKQWRESKASYRKPLNAAKVPALACAILIRRPEKKFGHWVAFDGQKILDPEKDDPLPLTTYDRNDWLVIRFLVPVF